MDLLGKHPAFDIYGTAGHKIYARNQAMPSSYIAKSAEIRESFVAEGCNIEGCITHSIISTGCTVGKGVEITDSVIMSDVTIENGAVVKPEAAVAYGNFIQNVINFLIISFSIYLMIGFVNKTRQRLAPEEEPEPEAPPEPTQEQLLAEIRDLLKENRAAALPESAQAEEK